MSYDGWRLKPRLRAFSEGRKARLRGLQTRANGASDGQRAGQSAQADSVAERSESVQARFQPPALLSLLFRETASSSHTSRMRRWWPPLFLLAMVAVMTLAACGSQGNPPTLGKSVAVTIRATSDSAALGQMTLTPAHGAHVVVYLHGALLPYENPQTPAQLRQGGCYGQVVAPLTANAPAGGSQVVVRPDTDKGANVALPVDANWFVVVLESAAPNAPVVACGHPLSDKRQYFDLYQPDKVDQGIGLGIALFESSIITQVHVSLAAPTMRRPAQWSIHSGGCQGSMLASGAIAVGATSGGGTAFATFDPQSWWLSVALNGAADPGVCVKAG